MFTIIRFTLSIIHTFCQKYTSNSCNISSFTKTASHAKEKSFISRFKQFCKLYQDNITEQGSHVCLYFLRGHGMNFKISCHTSAQLAHSLITLGSHLKLIWPRPSLKTTKMSQKGIFGKKLQESMG